MTRVITGVIVVATTAAVAVSISNTQLMQHVGQYLKAKEYAEKKAKEVEKVKNAINYYENLEY